MQKTNVLLISLLFAGLTTCNDYQTETRENEWNLSQLQLSMESLVDHAGHSARNSAWSFDNKFFAVVSYDSNVYVYDQNFNLIEIITLSTDRVRSVSWSPDNRYLAVGTEEPSLYIFHKTDLGHGAEPVHSLYNFGCRVNGLHFSPDSAYLAAGSGCTHRNPEWSGDLVILDVGNNFEKIRRFQQMEESYDVRWSPSGNFLGTTGTGIDNNLYVFDTSGDLPESWKLHSFIEDPYDGKSVTSLDWSRDEQFLVVGGFGNVTVYNVPKITPATIIHLPGEDDARVWRIRFSPNGLFLGICDGNQSTLYRVDNDDPLEWSKLLTIDDQTGRYFANSWTKDSRIWTVSSEDGSTIKYRLIP